MLLALGVQVLGAFVVVERRSSAPVIDLGLFAVPGFAAATLAAFVTGAATVGAASVLPNGAPARCRRHLFVATLQAGARTESQAIPTKGLTGHGYDGHAFWGTETFVLPRLTYTAPEAAKGALTWRHSTLPTATARAAELGLGGAAFPWRTIHGEEWSGYWPAGTTAFHVNT